MPAHFGLTTPPELAEAIHIGEIARRRVLELPPLVFAEAEPTTPSPRRSSTGSPTEVVALARAALTRLGLHGRAASRSCSAAGCCRRADGRVLDAIARGLRGGRAADRAFARRRSPPIVGAALLGLDELGATPRGARTALRAASSADRRPTRREEVERWLRCASSRRRASTRAPTRPRSTRSTSHIADGEFIVLVGPSGSGKTTALRMLAGLEEVDAGAILIGDRDVTDVRAEAARRRDGVPELRALSRT